MLFRSVLNFSLAFVSESDKNIQLLIELSTLQNSFLTSLEPLLPRCRIQFSMSTIGKGFTMPTVNIVHMMIK